MTGPCTVELTLVDIFLGELLGIPHTEKFNIIPYASEDAFLDALQSQLKCIILSSTSF